MPNPSAFEYEMADEKIKRHKAPGVDQIPAHFIKTGLEKFTLGFINLLILFEISRNCLRSGRSRSLRLAIKRLIKQIIICIRACHFCELCIKFFQHPAVNVNSICRGNYWGSSVWISTQHVKD